LQKKRGRIAARTAGSRTATRGEGKNRPDE